MMDALPVDPSLLGLFGQWVGALLFAVLLGLQARSVPRPWALWWARAWGARLVGYTALLVAFHTPSRPPALFALYFLGGYAFTFFMLVGCRSFAGEGPLRRRDLWVFAPLALLAPLLSLLPPGFDVQYAVHAGVLATAMGASAWVCARVPQGERGLGTRTMTVALLLSVLGLLPDLPLYVAVGMGWLEVPTFLHYDPFFDLTLQVLLGFGMGMASLERLQRELSRANERLETLARKDPLTEALNRHTFYALLKGGPGAAPGGCVVLLDMDGLKGINDRYGHAAGDEAIRAVAAAARGCVRADDLLFRWGGDEFLAVLWGLGEEEAERRFAALHESLAAARLQRAPGARVSVSLGISACEHPEDLERAVARADARMYLHKQGRREA